MRLKYNEFLAVVYADLFDWVLTTDETKSRQITSEIPGYKPVVQSRDGFVFLSGRERLIKLRHQREKISQKKITISQTTFRFLSKIPTIVAVFLTGSVAVGNAKQSADIDLMIITKQNTLWLTRATVFFFLKILKLIRSSEKFTDKICPNIFLSENNLKVLKKNLYTAHEILQARCIFDRGGIAQKWLAENGWTKNYLPNISQKLKGKSPRLNLKVKSNILVFLLNYLAFVLQYLYMKPKVTNEKIDLHYAFFHPNDLSDDVLKKFNQKLRQLGIMEE